MVKKKLNTEKIKNHSILDYLKSNSQKINQSNSSLFNNINKIPTKNEINNSNINLKKARKIRHFKRIKNIKPKTKNKKIKTINSLLNDSDSDNNSYNSISKFSFKYNDSDESSSSHKFNFNNYLESFNKYEYNNDSDSDSSSPPINLYYPSHKQKIKQTYNNDSIFNKIVNYNSSLDDNNDNNYINKDKIKPEWMQEKTEKTMYSKLRYNLEILDYIDYITPNGWEKAKREIAFDKLKQLVKSYNNNMTVVLFGSSKQNTCTVFSDIDVTIINDNDKYEDYYSFLEKEELNQLMHYLIKNKFSYDIHLINAKVPILKGTHETTGIKFDISYNRKNGYEDSFFIKNILEENDILRQAIIILKILLKENDLNEPYTGGMSSYLLFHLVYFFDIQCKRSSDMKYHNVFFFLFYFFEYFGTKFGFDMQGISLNEENVGKIFYKYNDYYMNDYTNICVEGFSERYVNIGKNCFNYEKIIDLFRDTFHLIKNALEDNTLSLLNKLGFPIKKRGLFDF